MIDRRSEITRGSPNTIICPRISASGRHENRAGQCMKRNAQPRAACPRAYLNDPLDLKRSSSSRRAYLAKLNQQVSTTAQKLRHAHCIEVDEPLPPKISCAAPMVRACERPADDPSKGSTRHCSRTTSVSFRMHRKRTTKGLFGLISTHTSKSIHY